MKVTGAEVKDYLEFSARYFKQVTGHRPVHDGRRDQRGHRDRARTARPDYNFDSVAGLDAPLTYDIDIAQPVGLADHEPGRTAACRSPARSSS